MIVRRAAIATGGQYRRIDTRQFTDLSLDLVALSVEPVAVKHCIVVGQSLSIGLGLYAVIAWLFLADACDSERESNDSDDECHRCQCDPETDMFLTDLDLHFPNLISLYLSISRWFP